ncbi:hypothetical protein L6R53_09835 [Myxococcota bacterium]|nr:hypothetical protein [Myxococcota bacterium]
MTPRLPPLTLLALALALVGAPVAHAQDLTSQAATSPAATSQAAGQLAQEQLPALAAREQAARARAAAATAWFEGRLDWGGAFPDLVGAPVFAAGFLDAGLAALDRAGQQRAAERVAAPPVGLAERDQARWRAAVQATLAAEDQADALRRQLLLGLRAASMRAPGLAELPGEAALRLDAARTAPEGADPAQAATAP